MTKLILVSALLFAFSCKSRMVSPSDVDIQAVEVFPCWAEKEAIRQLEAIRQKVEQGEDFAALAKQYSQDPGSSAHGGELGWVEKGMLVPEYEETMLAIQPGKISVPVKTKFGYHLIRLQEIDGEQYRSSHILLRLCE